MFTPLTPISHMNKKREVRQRDRERSNKREGFGCYKKYSESKAGGGNITEIDFSFLARPSINLRGEI